MLCRCCRLGVSHPQAAGPGQLAAAAPPPPLVFAAPAHRFGCRQPFPQAGCLSRCSLQQLCAATATSAALAKAAAAAAAASLRPAVLCLSLSGRLGLERQRVQPRGKLLLQRPVHQAVALDGVLPLEAVRHYLHSAGGMQALTRRPGSFKLAQHAKHSRTLQLRLPCALVGPAKVFGMAAVISRPAAAHLKCVSASGAPLGFPACPACLCDSLTTLRNAGFSASCSFLHHIDNNSALCAGGGGSACTFASVAVIST